MSLTIKKFKINNSKTIKSDNIVFSNKSKIKKNFDKIYNIEDLSKTKFEIINNEGYELTKIDKGINLFNGVTKKLKTLEDINDYVKTRHNGAFFLANKKIASMYGSLKDKFYIVYHDGIPAYYNDGERGTDLRFELTKTIYLLDIGNINNIKKLWHLIKDTFDADLIKKYHQIILKTCVEYNPDNEIEPQICFRTSYDLYDNQFVDLLCNNIIPLLKTNGITIDGWIYYKEIYNLFHNEILLCDAINKMVFVNKYQPKKTQRPKDIPSYEEYNRIKISKMYSLINKKPLPEFKFHTEDDNDDIYT